MNKILTANLGDVLEAVTRRLSPLSDTPQSDAEVLVAHVLNQPRTWLLAHDDSAVDPRQAELLAGLLGCLERGAPLPYVIGRWEFFGLDFEITPEVLIPRPETELLVERAIAWLRSSDKHRLVADIGTGSGCIAVSIAIHVPSCHILATDISRAALQVARRNARRHQVEHQIEFIECDILPAPSAALPQRAGSDARAFDLICANLPYIPRRKLQGLPVYGREPTVALDGGTDGLDLFRRLLAAAPRQLAPGGRMLLEIEATRGPAASSLAYAAFDEAEIHLFQDLAGQDRLLEIQLPHAEPS
ncbi:MAG TPA: peptide chain release factor N(5)-glutamine methyltransferase [Anaerolineales bacterium]|nr:peptide chain release factor N(5)-glutamine methyltransferase [Anaerolineales bacterium]